MAIELWFGLADIHHKHFFDHGFLIFSNNIVRLGFLVIFAWLIYAPGAAIAGALLRRSEQPELGAAEHGVLAFGFGIGFWHVLMLILGVAGLYHRSVVTALAAVIVLASARRFGSLAGAAISRLLPPAVWRRRLSPQTTGVVLISVFAGWLLLLRGLYPNADGDYYSHYFYYYLEILNNHSISPNDIWYHYFYSKGNGLFFLGMLLSDPEAPAIATFCCVVTAAAAMTVVINRFAPGSLWPGCVAALYLAFNLTGYRNFGSAQFLKSHEQVSALIVMMACALCLARGPAVWVWRAVAISSAIAVAIISPPVGVLIAIYFMAAAGWDGLRRRWVEMLGNGLAGTAVGSAVAAMLLLNYYVTGLADDHALGLMLRFADISRLDRWGVLPQLIIVAWMRANYLRLTPPDWNWAFTSMLPEFLRLKQLWVFLVGSALALVLLAARQIVHARSGARTALSPATETSAAIITFERVGSLVLVFAALSVTAGRGEPVSFLGVTSFFFPLLATMANAASNWATARCPIRWGNELFQGAFPALLLGATVVSWHDDWQHRVARDSDDALRFLVGNYSLADAYSHQDLGPPYGGINPRTLAAARQVAPGTPIWSTSIEYSYCAAPGCWVESVYSFKMSGRLDEIVSAPPDRSKQLLQDAGLNYFLVASDSRLIDILPYSKLFSPDQIGRYLAIQWTDGTAYLLTWSGSPGTTPLTPEFLASYRNLLDQPDQPQTRFRYLAPQLAEIVDKLRHKSWGAPVEFARQPTPAPAPDGTLDIAAATYGENCLGYTPAWAPFNTVYRGNATDAVREACSGKISCRLQVDARQLGDPAFGCDKDFSVTYRCHHDGASSSAALQPEASGKTADLSCSPAPP